MDIKGDRAEVISLVDIVFDFGATTDLNLVLLDSSIDIVPEDNSVVCAEFANWIVVVMLLGDGKGTDTVCGCLKYGTWWLAKSR